MFKSIYIQGENTDGCSLKFHSNDTVPFLDIYALNDHYVCREEKDN